MVSTSEIEFVLLGAIYSTPVWLPICFAAYAMGRREHSIRFWFFLITAEAVALAWTIFLFNASWLLGR